MVKIATTIVDFCASGSAIQVTLVKELRNRNADNLAEKMAEVNGVKKLCKVCPSAKVVTGWVEQAKTLAPMVTY